MARSLCELLSSFIHHRYPLPSIIAIFSMTPSCWLDENVILSSIIATCFDDSLLLVGRENDEPVCAERNISAYCVSGCDERVCAERNISAYCVSGCDEPVCAERNISAYCIVSLDVTSQSVQKELFLPHCVSGCVEPVCAERNISAS